MKSTYINGVDHQRSKCNFEIFKFTYLFDFKNKLNKRMRNANECP